MKITLDNGVFHCFGCGKTGNAIDFLHYMYPELDDLHLWLKYFKILKSKKVKKLKLSNRKLKRSCDKNARKQAKQYYEELPITNWNNVYKTHYCFKRGYSAEILNDVGAKINTSYNYPVIFPMYDLGRFKGTVSRTFSRAVEKKRKYLYNTGFDRATTVVGDYKKPWVVITEGYFDYLKLKQFLKGTKWKNNCVAILGWKITVEQAEKINKYTDKVISALDKTPTGRKGTKVLRKYFKHVVRFQFYSDTAKDVGDLDETDFFKSWYDTLELIENKKYK